MSSTLAKRARGKKLLNNVLEIALEAKNAKANNSLIINATAGMLLDENSKLSAFSSVEKVLNAQKSDEKYSYAATEASPKFEKTIYRHLFQNYYEEIKAKLHLGIIPTPGGSGAISNAIHNYLDQDEILLVPDICWGPYKLMAREYQVNVETFNYIQNEKFDRKSFLNGLKKIALKQKKILFIINDPCHNPSGFSLEYNDYEFIVETINDFAEKGITMIMLYDLAYLDFSLKDYHIKRECFRLFTTLKENASVILAFSASKTFSLYGMRLGAMIVMSKKEETSSEFLDANLFSARTKWSNITKSGVSFLENLDEKFFQEFYLELNESRKNLYNIGSLLYEEFKKTKLEIYPYHEGFFILIKINNPDEAFQKLKNSKIYTIPFPAGIRLSLSSLSIKEIPGLAQRIEHVLEG